jgi:hypothetical protein
VSIKLRYTSVEEVRVRLRGKTETNSTSSSDISLNRSNDNSYSNLSDAEYLMHIIVAESDVSTSLSKYYVVPFCCEDDRPFEELPDTTRVIITSLCIDRAIYIILTNYFGGGFGNLSEDFIETQEKIFNKRIDNILKANKNGTNNQNPLIGLKRNSDGAYHDVRGMGVKSISFGRGV